MDPLPRVIVDLNTVLVENHRDFQLLNFYKGVPVICDAMLEQVEAGTVVFRVTSPSAPVLLTQKSTTLLSDGLLEPIHAEIVQFDLPGKLVKLTDCSYAGSKYVNRHELRVEPATVLEIALRVGSTTLACQMADISMRGVGVRLPTSMLGEGVKTGGPVEVMLQIPAASPLVRLQPATEMEDMKADTVRLPGIIRAVSRSGGNTRISIEFTADVPEKVHVVRYIMRRRSEIFAEIQQMNVDSSAA